MATWAEETLEKLQQQEVGDEISLAEYRLRRAQQPHLWSDLRNWIKESCEELNEKSGRHLLEFEVGAASKAIVRKLDERGKISATLRVENDLDAARIRYDCGAGKGEFTFESSLRTSSVTITDPHHTAYSTEEAGRKLLDLLMRSPF